MHSIGRNPSDPTKALRRVGVACVFGLIALALCTTFDAGRSPPSEPTWAAARTDVRPSVSEGLDNPAPYPSDSARAVTSDAPKRRLLTAEITGPITRGPGGAPLPSEDRYALSGRSPTNPPDRIIQGNCQLSRLSRRWAFRAGSAPPSTSIIKLR